MKTKEQIEKEIQEKEIELSGLVNNHNEMIAEFNKKTGENQARFYHLQGEISALKGTQREE